MGKKKRMRRSEYWGDIAAGLVGLEEEEGTGTAVHLTEHKQVKLVCSAA